LTIRLGFTTLAAAGLVILMVGATGYTLATGDIGSAVFPIVTGALAAFVAYGRSRVVPAGARPR